MTSVILVQCRFDLPDGDCFLDTSVIPIVICAQDGEFEVGLLVVAAGQVRREFGTSKGQWLVASFVESLVVDLLAGRSSCPSASSFLGLDFISMVN